MTSMDKPGNSWPIVPYGVAPVLLARFLCRGRWIDVLQAYGIWIGLLALFGFMHGGPHREDYGWALPMALFSTVLAIPIFVVLLNLRNDTWHRGVVDDVVE